MNKVKSHLKHKKHSKIVYEVELTFHKALNLSPKDQDKQVYVVWRRGNNHTGQTSKIKQRDTSAVWDDNKNTGDVVESSPSSVESTEKNRDRKDSLKSVSTPKDSNLVQFRCSLYRNAEGAFDPKMLEVKLKQEKEKSKDGTKKNSSRSIGEISLNLAELAEKVGEQATQSIPISQALTKKKKGKEPKVTACKLQFTVKMSANGVVIMKNPVYHQQHTTGDVKTYKNTQSDDREIIDIQSQYSRHSSHSLSSSPETIRTTSTKSSNTKNSRNSQKQSVGRESGSADGHPETTSYHSGYSSLSDDEVLSDEEDSARLRTPTITSSGSTSNSSNNSPRRWMHKQESMNQLMSKSLVEEESKQKISPVLSASNPHVFGTNLPVPKVAPQQRVQLENFRKGHRRARSDVSAFSFTQASNNSAPNPVNRSRLGESSGGLNFAERSSLLRASTSSSPKAEKKGLNIGSLDHTEINEIIAKQEQELLDLKQKLAEKQLIEDQNFLIEKVVLLMEPGYFRGIPVTASLLFRCMMQWNSFDRENSRFLDKLFESFEGILEKHLYNNTHLLYWLCTCCFLLQLVRKEVQVISTCEEKSQNNPVKSFERRLQSLIGGYYTTLLRALYEKLDPILVPAILEQPPLGTPPTGGQMDAQSVISVLSAELHQLKLNFISHDITEQFYRQVFYHLNERLFNTLLQRKELCRCGNGVLIKMAVSQLEEWVLSTKIHRNVSEQLAALRNAADVLVMNKAVLAEWQDRREACPALNDKQIYHILRNYTPDEFDQEPVHPAVLAELSAIERESDQMLFDGQFAFPLMTTLDSRVDLDSPGVPIPDDLLQRPGFAFLRDGM